MKVSYLERFGSALKTDRIGIGKNGWGWLPRLREQQEQSMGIEKLVEQKSGWKEGSEL